MKTITKNIVLAALNQAGMQEVVRKIQNKSTYPGELLMWWEKAQAKIEADREQRRKEAEGKGYLK